jgi:flagellar basal-body rod protein FlgC
MSFSIIDIGRTGAGFSKYWLDTVAHNIANVNTVSAPGEEPFRARMVQAQEAVQSRGGRGSGVFVRDVRAMEGEAPKVYDPDHPLADEDGNVTHAVVDLPAEMSNLIQAQRSYQLSLKVIDSGREAYQSALRLGSR